MLLRRLTILALPVAALACVSDNGGQPSDDGGPGLPETSSTTPDASVADTSVADTSVADTSVADTASPPVDGPVDSPADTTPPPVTILVLNQGAPEPGMTIVFNDASGAVITTAVTDALGKAAQVVPAGSQVTALLGKAASPQVVTITSVQPGDVLTAIDVSFPAQQVEVDGVPPSPPDAGPDAAFSYSMNVGRCGTTFTTPPGSVSLSPQCVNGSKFPLLVLAEDPTFTPTGFTYLNGNSLLAADDAGIVHLSPSLAWSTATTTQTVSATNSTALTGSGTLAYSEISGGVPYPGTSVFPAADDAGAVSSQFPAHTGYPDAVQAEVNMFTSQGTGASYVAIATRSAPPAASGSTSFDLTTFLPLITAATVDTTTTGTTARPNTTWTAAGSLAGTAGAIVSLTWTAQLEAGFTSGTWTIVAPPTATGVQLPTLPAASAAYVLPSNASIQIPVVVFVKGSVLSGYPELRATSGAFPVTNIAQGGAIVMPLPSNGTLWLTAFGGQLS